MISDCNPISSLVRRHGRPALLAALGWALLTAPAAAQQRDGNRPLSAEELERMVPRHPDYLGALAPENLNRPRPAPPFNLTGTWFVDLSEGFNRFMFGPPYPEFFEGGQEALREAPLYAARNEPYRDSIGQCYPPGMPMIMTRVWPHAFIQLPTAIYMISGFNNSLRTIFLDGRSHSDPDRVVPSYNGESIGRWEGDVLVVHTRHFEPDNHWIDRGIPISEEFEIIERIRLLDDGRVMEIEFIMTDPQNWVGEWRSTKRFTRQDYTDINESNCILAYNDNLPGTDRGSAAAAGRGQSELLGETGDE